MQRISIKQALETLKEITALKEESFRLLERFIHQTETIRNDTIDEVAEMFDRSAKKTFELINTYKGTDAGRHIDFYALESQAFTSMRHAANIRKLKTAYTEQIIKPLINISA